MKSIDSEQRCALRADSILARRELLESQHAQLSLAYEESALFALE